MTKVIHWAGAWQAGKWRWALKTMRQCWLAGMDTMYISPDFDYIPGTMPSSYLRWLGEMEMFKHEGGLLAYNRYRKYMVGLW